MARADAKDTAIARGQAHGTAAISAESEINQVAGNSHCRAARGSTRYAIGRLRIDWRPIMYVLAVEAVCHLIAMGLPDHTGACRDQTINGRRGAWCRRMCLEP